MEVVCTRVTPDELAKMKERAEVEFGGQVSTLVRTAIREYLAPKPSHLPWKRAKESGHPVLAKECDHPPSRVMQGPIGVYCDQCGTSL